VRVTALARRILRHDAFPPSLAVGALLLFCWPIARYPRLPLVEGWLHLLGAWALAIAALALRARALRAPPAPREEP
jgi:hypothetical protein